MNQSVRRSPVSGHQNDDPSLVSLDSESTPGRPSGLRLLSLDGGGVRGLSTLYILKCLMAQLNHKRKIDGCPAVRPCDVFDLIGGTSTGGFAHDIILPTPDAVLVTDISLGSSP